MVPTLLWWLLAVLLLTAILRCSAAPAVVDWQLRKESEDAHYWHEDPVPDGNNLAEEISKAASVPLLATTG